MTPLYGHTSEDTAYLVPSYPYGRLRCQIKFWLEHDIKRGYRFCSRTEDPKRPGHWNAIKRGTYSLIAACMYLDSENHCVNASITEYTGSDEVIAFIKSFPENDTISIKAWVLGKVAFYRRIVSGTAYMKINGEKRERSEYEVEQDAKTLAGWEEALALLVPKGETK
jgi:hypothetical protein